MKTNSTGIQSNWNPEILYEENEEGTSSVIPFIMVPEDRDMPNLLFIFESKETGEFDINSNGDPIPIYEWDLHQYADMNTLKNGLDTDTYDKVRFALGLERLSDAAAKGQKITEKVANNVTK